MKAATLPRIFAIIHLSFIFLYLLWILSIPFFHTHFEAKQRERVVHYLEKFEKSLTPRQMALKEKVKKAAYALYSRSVLQKSFDSFSLLFLQMPLLYWGWIGISFTCCLSILRQSENSLKWALVGLVFAGMITVQTLSEQIPQEIPLQSSNPAEALLLSLEGLARLPSVALRSSHTPSQASIFLFWHLLLLLAAYGQSKELKKQAQ